MRREAHWARRVVVPCRRDDGLEFQVVCYGVSLEYVQSDQLTVPLADRLTARGMGDVTMLLTAAKSLSTPWRKEK